MGVASGNSPAGTVRDALTEVRDLLCCASGAIIRSLDSAHSELDLSRILSFHGVEHAVSSGSVCVTMTSLWRAVEQGVMTGFDEVWIHGNGLPAINLENVPGATSDGVDFSAGIPAGLADAMDATDCILVLGDGCGLNYATPDHRIAERLSSNVA